MTLSRPATGPILSELGGALGRIAAVPGDDQGSSLPAIRLRLATALFEAAGPARAAAAAGDRAAAIGALAPGVWRAAWEGAVGAAGDALAEAVESDIKAAAAMARLPSRLLERRLLTAAERRAMTAHLGRGTGRLAAALRELDGAAQAWASSPSESGDHSAGFRRWDDAVQAVARRMEAAWLELQEARHAEASRWRVEVGRIASWRRPRWPLWVVTAALVALASYLGLVTGGYLPAPGPLRPLVDLWWGGP